VGRRTINEVLADAQARLPRLSAAEAAAAMSDGATLVDTRSNDLRLRDGSIPGAIQVPLSVLEWRVDGSSGHPSPALAGRTDRLILICEHGYSSSLAALRLRELGFAATTAVVGGFRAWVDAGLPVQRVDPRPSVFGAATVIVRDGRVLLVRHTYAELALRSGMRLDVVSRQLGHASISTTANVYLHENEAASAEAAELTKLAETTYRDVNIALAN